MDRKWLVLVTLLTLAIITACQPASEVTQSATLASTVEAETSTPTTEVDTPAPPTATAALVELTTAPKTPKPTLEKSPVSERVLSLAGPWWLFQAEGGLWALNPDGSGLTLIHELGVDDPALGALKYSPAPGGGLVALLEIENRESFSPPTLSLLSLPEGYATPISKLHPSTSDAETEADAYDRWVATGVLNTLAWSPDGGHLAFNGVIDGDSGDLYLYTLASSELQRLTSGPTESVFPSWSPDGRRIVHGAVTRLNSQMSGAGYDYTGVWSAAVDDSGVDLLFESEIVGFERVVGWLGDSVLLMDSETPNVNPFCSYTSLQRLDLEGGERELILAGPYAARTFDPTSGVLLFSVPSETGCEGELQPGLYFMDLGSGLRPLPVVEDVAWEMAWSPEANLFFASTDLGVLAVDKNGQFIDLVVPEESFGLPIVATGSRRLAWGGNGLWIGTLQDNIEQQPQELHTGRVWEMAWSADGQNLLYVTGDAIYVASEPDLTPRQVADFRGFSPIWVPAAPD